MKGIVLCSGGLDSTLALLKLLKEGHTVVPMFVDYNQWSLEGEEEALYNVSAWADVYFKSKFDLFPEVVRIDWGGEEERVGSVWGRNIALVGLAAMWAYTHGDDYEFIALGNHRGDVGPDCKPGKFDFYLDELLKTATKDKMEVLLPIRQYDTALIGKELAGFSKELFDLTYSCYWYPPCRYRSIHDEYLCPGCRRKVLAMKAAGVTDEKLLELPNCRERTYQSNLAEKTGY